MLQEIREWEEAKKTLNDLDQETPEVLRKGRKNQPNWPKQEITLAKGWLLLYEDRLKEAEKYFWNLRKKAPANTSFRTGLAHAYLWRGWPRKALHELKITETLDPRDLKIKVGKLTALNELAFKEQARKEAQDLLQLHPKNKHIQGLIRKLKLEEIPELVADFVITSDDEGFNEIEAGAKLSQPLSLYTDIYGFLFWQRSLSDDLLYYFRRAGIGIDHIFNSSWRFRQQFSANYNKADDFGSFTLVDFTPDDYWRLSLLYDSFTTDIPIRARVFDIEADRVNAAVIYRESDLRSYNLSFSRLKFSDDNKRYQGVLGYEQGLYIKNDWKMRFFLDFYTSSNSSKDVPYFNPDYDFSLSATHLTEHTIMDLYRKAFVQRLFLTLGAYKQNGFSIEPIGSIRYEHDIDFSDTHSLLFGIHLGRQAFDGEAVTNYSFYSTWRLLH